MRILEQALPLFPVDVGVRQGCVCSPSFFILFIDDAIREVNQLGYGASLGERSRLANLLYADGIALFAEPAAQLQNRSNLIPSRPTATSGV
jgi:hypothetical protein